MNIKTSDLDIAFSEERQKCRKNEEPEAKTKQPKEEKEIARGEGGIKKKKNQGREK